MSKAKRIEIKCTGSRMAELKGLAVIQGDLKTLSKENAKKLRTRIETKGFDAPFFVWDNNILDGTQRKKVLEQMMADGWELPGGKVPVCDIEAADLADAKDRLLGFVSQYGKLDGEGLHDFLEGFPELDLETLDLPDFDLDEFNEEWLNGGGREGLTDPDDVPEPPKVAITKPGDLWLLGEHRLLCGDSTKVENVDKLMGGVKADILRCDRQALGGVYRGQSETWLSK